MSETKFSEIYKISRTTVRQALRLLEKEGYINKVHGKGSYISSLKICQNRSTFTKFYDDVIKLGKKPFSKILSSKIKVPNDNIREKMLLSCNEKIFEIIWIRYSNKEALIYETIYLNYSLVKGIENLNLETKKLYDILNDDFSIKKVYGNEMFYPFKLSKNEAKFLNLFEGDLGIKFERTVFKGGRVLEYTNSIVRGDKFVYLNNFSGNLKDNN